MRRINLTKLQARVLALNLEIKPTGFSRRELRTLQIIQDKIEDALGDYQGLIEAAVARTRAQSREARRRHADNPTLLQQTIQHILDVQNDELEELNEQCGQEPISLILEDPEYHLVGETFGTVESFNGARETRQVVLALSDALERSEVVIAETVKPAAQQHNGHDRAPVPLEPRPLRSVQKE